MCGCVHGASLLSLCVCECVCVCVCLCVCVCVCVFVYMYIQMSTLQSLLLCAGVSRGCGAGRRGGGQVYHTKKNF